VRNGGWWWWWEVETYHADEDETPVSLDETGAEGRDGAHDEKKGLEGPGAVLVEGRADPEPEEDGHKDRAVGGVR